MTATIDKTFVKSIRTDIDAALASVEKKFGVTLRCGNATFDPTGSFKFNLEGTAASGKTKEHARFDRSAQLLGVPKKWKVGDMFEHGRRAFKLVGLNSTGTKLLIDGCFDGKSYQMRVDAFVRGATPL